MKLNRFVSSGCAAALALGMMPAAFAIPAGVGGSTSGGTTSASTITDISSATDFEYQSEVEMGDIKLTMSTTGNLYVNPYGIDVTVNTDTLSQEKIISPTQFIKNESDTGIAVSITPTVTPASGVTLVESTAFSGKTDKSVTVGFEIQSVTDGEAEPTWTATPIDLAATAVAGKLTPTGVVMAKPAKDSDGALVPTYAAFRVKGDAVENPVTTPSGGGTATSNPWTSSDTVGVKVAFTFTPNNTGTVPPVTPSVTASITGGDSLSWSGSQSGTVGGTTVNNMTKVSLTPALSTGDIKQVVWTIAKHDSSVADALSDLCDICDDAGGAQASSGSITIGDGTSTITGGVDLLFYANAEIDVTVTITDENGDEYSATKTLTMANKP